MKKIFKIVAVVAIVVTVGFTAYNAQTNELQLSSLAMDNVEAIARGEINPECPNGCLTYFGHCYCNGYHPLEEYMHK